MLMPRLRKARKNKMLPPQKRTSQRLKRKNTTLRASKRRPQNRRQPRMQIKRKWSPNLRRTKKRRQKIPPTSQWSRRSPKHLRSRKEEQRQLLPTLMHHLWRRSKSKKLAWPSYTLSLRILRSKGRPFSRAIAQSIHSSSMKTILQHKSSLLNSKSPLMSSSICQKEFWILS